MTDFRQALVEVRKVLQIANDLEDGPIYDTIWMTNGMTTLFDFIDATLAAQPPELDAQNVDKLMDLAEDFAQQIRYNRYEMAHFARKELETALRAAINPQPVALPMPGSPEASAMIDTMLERYQYPANMKNAARAGYEAARALLAAPQAPEPTMPQWPEGPVRKQTIGEAFEAWCKEK